MSVIDVSSIRSHPSDAVRDSLAATVSRSMRFMNDPATSIVQIDAGPFLEELRSLVGSALDDVNEGKTDLLRGIHQESGGSSKLNAARDIVLDVIDRTVLGALQSMVFVQRAWDKVPYYHVDTAALTMVLPLRNAPTFYTLDRFVDGSEQASFGCAMPLNAIRHSEAMPASVFFTGDNEIVLMKGVAWAGIDDALVHSPPHGPRGKVSPPVAKALILEFDVASRLTAG